MPLFEVFDCGLCQPEPLLGRSCRLLICFVCFIQHRVHIGGHVFGILAYHPLARGLVLSLGSGIGPLLLFRLLRLRQIIRHLLVRRVHHLLERGNNAGPLAEPTHGNPVVQHPVQHEIRSFLRGQHPGGRLNIHDHAHAARKTHLHVVGGGTQDDVLGLQRHVLRPLRCRLLRRSFGQPRSMALHRKTLRPERHIRWRLPLGQHALHGLVMRQPAVLVQRRHQVRLLLVDVTTEVQRGHGLLHHVVAIAQTHLRHPLCDATAAEHVSKGVLGQQVRNALCRDLLVALGCDVPGGAHECHGSDLDQRLLGRLRIEDLVRIPFPRVAPCADVLLGDLVVALLDKLGAQLYPRTGGHPSGPACDASEQLPGEGQHVEGERGCDVHV